jgi:hypothetical protein
MLHAHAPRSVLAPCSRAHAAPLLAAVAALHPVRHRAETHHCAVTQRSDTSCSRSQQARAVTCRSLKSDTDKIMDMLDTGKKERLDVINRFYNHPTKQVPVCACIQAAVRHILSDLMPWDACSALLLFTGDAGAVGR